MNGPSNVLLRSPEMGDLAQQLEAYLRFHSLVPDKLREFAIVDAVGAGERPVSMQPDEEAV